MEIITQMANSRYIETMLKGIAKVNRLTPDMQDLCQMVYLALLQYDDDKIEGLWARDEMHFFISRILTNNYNSKNSRYYYCITRFTEQMTGYEGHDKIDE